MPSIRFKVNHRLISRALSVFALLYLAGCAGFLGLEKAPEMVPGTNIEIIEVSGGIDYVIEIGRTDTTVFQAILSGSGQRYLGYVYQDSYGLYVRRMEVHTFATIESLDSNTPVQKDLPEGGVMESDQMSAPNNLFERILETPAPMLALVGDSGTVMLEMGDRNKSRLAELVAYDAEHFDGR